MIFITDHLCHHVWNKKDNLLTNKGALRKACRTRKKEGVDQKTIKKSARKRNSRKERAGIEKRQVQYEYM